MKKYDFDRQVERRNSDSLKWNAHAQHGHPENLLPLWVADMDFEVMPEVRAALVARAELADYGYGMTCQGHHEAVQAWMKKRHGWQIQEDWITVAPGVVFAFSLAIRALTQPGDAIMIQSPVYYPFGQSIQKNGRRMVDSPLVYAEGHYHIDFEDVEKKMQQENVKAFLLCSPHNPVGRVWRRQELQQLADICDRQGVAVISDEIHHDLVFAPHIHTPFPLLEGEAARRCVVCTAPSKTFNLAGLQHANIIIADKERRQAFRHEINALGYGDYGTFASLACREAYRHGAGWLDALLAYLQGNMQYLRQRLEEDMPRLKLVAPEGLYLAWVDARGLAMDAAALERFMLKKAGLWLDEGYIFGAAGSGFERINVACPRSTLATAMDRLAVAYQAEGF